ncbi:Hypothetical Protein FCC1311_117502, partial [Hondaea fermentalgiana]
MVSPCIATLLTGDECPFNTCCSKPDVAFQMRTVLSLDPLTMVSP